MRSLYLAGFAALLAAGPAMGQVIIQNGDSARHEQRAAQERSEAHFENQQARRRAAVGDYAGAAQAQNEARHDWHAARHQDERARQESGGIVIGR